jgi:hypothetical protein
VPVVPIASRPFLSDLKALTGDKGGRFLAAVIKHVGQQEPKLLERVFAQQRGALSLESDDVVVTEFPYRANRRADIAVLRRGEVLALAELKYRDQRGAEVDSQIGDYLSHCRSSKIAFALLTEFEPRLDARTRIDPRLRIVTYHELAGFIRELKPRSDAARGALALLLDYLKHEVTM